MSTKHIPPFNQPLTMSELRSYRRRMLDWIEIHNCRMPEYGTPAYSAWRAEFDNTVYALGRVNDRIMGVKK